jgi:A/G-specific adenine glycosylase
MNRKNFQELLWQKARELYRPMPWREDTQPYYILVSELMLQQTQVDRVIPKFEAFIARFPDVESLSKASLSDVLVLWNGLGYNRRAKYLHDAAKKIIADFNGNFPETKEELLSLPGVGPGTAGALLAYAFNKQVVFIETNVRSVYFYHFFEDGNKVSDAELAERVEATLDQEHPREFYWALMDYGTWLKKNKLGRIVQSVHYKKQSALKGSLREMRGNIIKHLSSGDTSVKMLESQFGDDDRYRGALDGLIRDGLVSRTNERFHLTK